MSNAPYQSVMDFEVAPYRPPDFTPVCRLELRGEGCGYPAAVFVRQMEEITPSTFFVARSGGKVIGFTVGIVTGSRNRDAWVLRLRGLPEYQRKGIGSALMHRLLLALASIGAGQIFLSVAPGNTAALALYRKLGFTVTAKRGDYFGPGEDRCILRREISGPLHG
jgi:ribosomal-protein-alanine N-acetyltransferase